MANNKQLEPLVKALKGKTVDDFKKVTLAQKRKLNNEIKAIPIRIDELHNSLPSLEVDFDSIEKDLAFNESELRVVDACILDSATFYDDLSKKRELLYEKKTQLQKREYLAELERDKPLQELKDQLSTTEDAIRTTDLHRKALTSEEKEVNRLLESATKTIEAKREEWHKVNSETLEFDEHDFVCPTCNREFEDVDIKIKQEEISKRFISNKANIIQEINTVGALYAQDVLGYQERLEQLDVEIKQKQDYLSKLEDNKVIAEKAIKSYVPGSSLETNSEYLKLKEEIEGIEKSIDTTSMDSTVSKLQEEKAKITGAIDSIKYELSKKEQSEKIQKRINVLKDEEKTLAQQITQLEGQEYLCDEFVRKKVSFLESRINSYFKKVTFKLFNTLVNGSIEECCETLIDGVPFQDANNAGKINAGIDIINTLSKHFKVSAPIFIDNREGVIELQETDAQIVNLRVSEVSKYSKDALSDKKELIGTNNKKLYMEVI